ncbi:MAG TPA: hypothetical protein VGR28_10670 [Candidatus Thermoplasmatota archaeon]|nr:hypothetical protein [Candidatus Thermoplasmatota archaeon]
MPDQPDEPKPWEDWAERAGPSTMNVDNCARCGEHHDGLEIKAFLRPVRDADGEYPFWASCPATGDPILVRVVTPSISEN